MEQKPHSQKESQNEKSEDYVPDDGKDKTPQKQLNEGKIGNLSKKNSE